MIAHLGQSPKLVGALTQLLNGSGRYRVQDVPQIHVYSLTNDLYIVSI